MLTTHLEGVWTKATHDDRVMAIAWATTLLQNLVHYHAGRYTPDDRERLAAELLAKLQDHGDHDEDVARYKEGE